jgi:hypothetical protein
LPFPGAGPAMATEATSPATKSAMREAFSFMRDMSANHAPVPRENP